MDVVRRLKPLTGQRKIGHGGTLDPDASGVLPVCIGRATRFINYVVDGNKQYSMTVRLGEATETYDASGKVTATSDPSSVSRELVENTIQNFIGEIQQIPPMYSALKHHGQPLYRLARKGIEVKREPRQVKIFSIWLSGWQPPDFMLEVDCGRGFYARSLAHDLGEAMGGAAHLLQLVRGQAGLFKLDDSVLLDEFEARVNLGNWQDLVYPIDFVLMDLPMLVVDPLKEELVRNGQQFQATLVSGHPSMSKQKARVYSMEGHLIAVARYDPAGLSWFPERVIQP